MRLLHGLDELRSLPAGSALCVGNFDGVHLGHRKIIDRLVAADASAVAIITFEPHPMSALRPDAIPPRLTTASHKRALLEEAGVTHVVELPATPAVLELSDQDFWQIVRKEARPTLWVEGRDFRFGKGATGTVDRLRSWAAGTEVTVEVVDQAEVVLPGLQVVSAASSLVRWLVAHGRVADAAAVLGRPHELRGTVVSGKQRGRTIGFPTANVDVHDHLIPADGVYAGTAVVDGQAVRAAISIGTNPTFDGVRRTVEAHLLDFAADLYDKTLHVQLTRWLRGQVRYGNVDALVDQLHADVADTRRLVA